MSRLSIYSDEIAESICTLLSEGHSLVQVCQREDMPHRTTVMRWLDSNPDFAKRYARAREAQADFIHDEMVAIEAEVRGGDLAPEVARVVLSSKQWRASKLAPRRYGDKTIIEGGAPIQVQHTRKLDISTLSDEQLDALEGALRATVAQLEGQGKAIDHEEPGC